MAQITTHPLDPKDATITAAMREMLSARKGARLNLEARGQYDVVIQNVASPSDVTFESGTLGGVSGVWVRPEDSSKMRR